MIGKWFLRLIAVGYVALLVLIPVGVIGWRTFEHGATPVWAALTTPDALHAIKLTVLITLIAVPANTVFGVLCGILLVRRRFPGKSLLGAAVALPLGISPVVVGLALIIVYGRFGWLGGG